MKVSWNFSGHPQLFEKLFSSFSRKVVELDIKLVYVWESYVVKKHIFVFIRLSFSLNNLHNSVEMSIPKTKWALVVGVLSVYDY